MGGEGAHSKSTASICDFSTLLRVNLERVKGFEPSTPTLARSCSTPELHPRSECMEVGLYKFRLPLQVLVGTLCG